MSLQLYPHISADADVLAGQPVIEGTAVAVSLLVEQMATGKRIDEVAREYGVTVDDVRAALEYAAQRAAESAIGRAAAAARGSDSGQLSDVGAAEARRLGLDPAKLSPLGRRLLEQRGRILASGIPPMTWDELDAEMAEQRRSGGE